MSSPTVPEPSTTEKAPLYKFVAMCVIMAGLVLTENVSGNLMLKTVRNFTPNADTIGYIKSINPLFGFISQPLVGWLSDRIWTPLGRRGFFLITGAPVVGLSLWIVPELGVLWHLVVWIVIWQCFQDVLWGSDHPLMADLFPREQRPVLGAWMACAGSLTGMIFLDFFLEWDDVVAYRVVAVTQLVLVCGASFFLHEKPPKNLPPGKKWAYIPLDPEQSKDKTPILKKAYRTVKWYAGEIFDNSIFTRFAILNFSKFLGVSMVTGWVFLFATETLQLTKDEFGDNWKLEPLITLIFAVPAGWFIGKYCPKQWTMVVGFAIMMIACVFGWFAETGLDLMVVAIIFAIGHIIDKVTYKPFFTEFLPAAKIGMLTGAFNIFFGLGRWFSDAGGGNIIRWFGNDYRVIWPVAFIVFLVSIVIMATIPDIHYANRKEAKKNSGGT